MRGTKRYSKSTTKKAIDTEKDPYLSKGAPGGAASVCSGCGAVYEGKRWRLARTGDKTALKGAGRVKCPACKKIRDRFAGGYVTLRGDFLKEHNDEIMNLIRNKEARAMYTNPLERIIKVSRKKDEVEITTTTEKLAQRIGQMLYKSFKGEIKYKWSGDAKVARVEWSR